MNIVSLMTSYYHAITIECMIISNLWSQENLTYFPEKKKQQRDNQESSWNKQSKSQSWGDDWGGNESYGRVTDEVQLAGLLLTSWCVIHLHPWGRGPCSMWLHLHIHMTNLDIIVKSRDITLLTKVHIVKAMLFPVVTYDVRVGP